MSGWDGWAATVASTGDFVTGVAVYCPKTGQVFGKCGEIQANAGALNIIDQKVEGKDVSTEELVNGKKFMPIKKVPHSDKIELNIFKGGSDSLVTLPGPTAESRIAVYIKGQKPEPFLGMIGKKMEPHVNY